MLNKLWVVAALVAAPVVVSAQALPEKYQAGVHYEILNPAQPTTVAGNKVEVLEIFSYMCGHCDTFQPHVESWKKKMPAQAQLVYMPAIFNQQWELAARSFYTAKAFGVIDKTHQGTFDVIHHNPKPAQSMDDLVNQLAAMFAKNAGIKPDAYKSTLNSFAVNMDVERSKSQVPRYKVEGTPEVIVAGKYRITGKSANGYDKLFDVVNFLVAKEAAARGLNKSVAATTKPAPVKTVPVKTVPAKATPVKH